MLAASTGITSSLKEEANAWVTYPSPIPEQAGFLERRLGKAELRVISLSICFISSMVLLKPREEGLSRGPKASQ